MRTPNRRGERGSTLLVAMILLAVLSVIGVTSVMLASRERSNAAAKTRLDQLVACARAAQAQIWGELAKYGPGYLASQNPLASPLTLAGGVTVAAPAHYSSAMQPGWKVNNVVVGFDKGVSNGTQAMVGDLSNRAVGLDALNSGQAYRVTARCTDPRGRELEVEFSMRFTLF